MGETEGGWGGVGTRGPKIEADFSGGIVLGQPEETGQRGPHGELYQSK